MDTSMRTAIKELLLKQMTEHIEKFRHSDCPSDLIAESLFQLVKTADALAEKMGCEL